MRQYFLNVIISIRWCSVVCGWCKGNCTPIHQLTADLCKNFVGHGWEMNMDLLLCIVSAHWRRRLQGSRRGKLRPWSIQPWGLSLFLLMRPMNSTTFIPGNLDSESAMDRVVWILMELNAYSNLFARVRYGIHRSLVVKVILLFFMLLISTQYQCSENVMFYRGNQARTATHFVAVNARHRFFCWDPETADGVCANIKWGITIHFVRRVRRGHPGSLTVVSTRTQGTWFAN